MPIGYTGPVQSLFPLAADLVLLVHATFVAFVVFSLPLILIGGVIGWGWIHNWWFRLIHLACIGIVVIQAWLGMLCPLTTLENWLRLQGSEAAYQVSFIQYWLHRILYYQAPAWVFGLVYTLFGSLVLLAWWRFPPRRSDPS